MKKALMGISVFLIATTSVCFSQAKKESEPKTLSQVQDRALSGVEKEFVPAAEAMPDDKYDFAPSTGEFKGVRTFAQQVKHVAAVNFLVASTMLNEKPPMELGGENGPDSMKSKADIVKFLKDSFEYSHKAFAATNEKNSVQAIKSPFGEGHSTRLGLSTLIVAHCFDHYGQMAVYLRMNGTVPPASRQ
jgi:uncharacterized damage-inducible protein DinB